MSDLNVVFSSRPEPTAVIPGGRLRPSSSHYQLEGVQDDLFEL